MANYSEYSGVAPSITDSLKRCSIHKKNYKLICLDEYDQPGLIFKCKKCAKVAPNNKYINISEFIYSTDRHVFDYLPNIPNDLKQASVQTLNNKQTNKFVEIEHFFKELKSKLMVTIEEMRKQTVEKQQQVCKFKEIYAKEYKKMTRKDEIKKIIEDKSTIEEKSKNIKKELSEIFGRSIYNQDIMNKLLMQQKENIKSLEQTELLNQVKKGLQKMFGDDGQVNEHSYQQSKSQNYSSN